MKQCAVGLVDLGRGVREHPGHSIANSPARPGARGTWVRRPAPGSAVDQQLPFSSLGAHVLGMTWWPSHDGRSLRTLRGPLAPSRPMRCVLVIIALSFFPGPAVGTTFSVPLPDLVGVVDFPTIGSGKKASFNFGQQFSDIQNVWIGVEAQVFAREFDFCGTLFDPQPCVHETQLLGFWALMDDEDSPITGFVLSDDLSFGDFRALEGSGGRVAPFNNPVVGWDFLLDGAGSLTLFWNAELVFPDQIIRNVIEPSGEIFNARLFIEGTPVPEPSTSLLLAAGLLVLTRARMAA